jgi:hypothetical protein
VKLWVAAIPVVVLAAVLPMASQTSYVYAVNGRIPLGIETFRLQPDGHEFYLMASAENPGFQGLKRETDHSGREHLVNSHGEPVKFYPSRVQFRVTASSRESVLKDSPWETHAKVKVVDMLRELKFRVKVFHALEYRYVKPKFVEEVGVPDKVPYDERIYRVGFELGEVPIDDRVVMEVISPSGERLCKFHLDL